ncbi:MAG TPA: class I SAM-dependent methyltransferase family protein [Thermoplasmata archaeon]|nr:class I SAM-dependent methyltransferase family protein [Thermoplasmata archaeon]
MTAPRRPPAERVRDRLRAAAGAALAAEMPPGYQRLGRVLVLRLPPSLRPYHALLGAAWQAELGVETVLVRTGPIDGELREPATETIAGTTTETEVVEHGVRWTFDAARIMFAAGNRTERRRAGALVRAGEVVADLFAGIGYFAIPAARTGRPSEVIAVEKNPVAVGYLRRNVAVNGVGGRVRIVAGDNRAVELPRGGVDRVFLGYLPSAVPWVGRALALLRPAGGWLHVHTVDDARRSLSETGGTVAVAVRAAGGTMLAEPAVRAVKPYGPGRTHVVVDARARPGPGPDGRPR